MAVDESVGPSPPVGSLISRSSFVSFSKEDKSKVGMVVGMEVGMAVGMAVGMETGKPSSLSSVLEGAVVGSLSIRCFSEPIVLSFGGVVGSVVLAVGTEENRSRMSS